jgi:1-aminocyclopropane-1-carboxylate deaminase/D-cysteine desulfhydrase-like pyridoxal-dependent ACC family enzyme
MTALNLYLDHTPIEEHSVNTRDVYVKRDDLYGCPPAPPLGKLRGLRLVLEEYYEAGLRVVGCWDTRVSKLGQGLAAACLEFPGMRPLVFYPTRRGVERPPSMTAAEELGAEVQTFRGNHVDICYAQARRHVERVGGRMLPFGMECPKGVAGVGLEAANTPKEIACGTLVLSCGSGVTLAGILNGLPCLPRQVVAVSSGRSISKIWRCLHKYLTRAPSALEVLPAIMPYDAVPRLACPFPTHPNYDLKAWSVLVQRIDLLRDPIFFWNIGA